MNTDIFFSKVRTYHNISEQSESAWKKLLQLRKYQKNENFLAMGQHPKKVGFVVSGLFSQNTILEDGSVTIKHFFPEHRFAASLVAMLTKQPSDFYITAIENSMVLEYDFFEFKKLFQTYPDLALFYIAYNERHWIIEKEPLEIAWRAESSARRYDDFLKQYPTLIKRLKKHHIASYLGITPTQLSRIFLVNK